MRLDIRNLRRLRSRIFSFAAVLMLTMGLAWPVCAQEAKEEGTLSGAELPVVDEAPNPPSRPQAVDGDIQSSPRQTTDAARDDIATAAAAHALPLSFFRRLIWQESHFNPRARSPAGAQGIAQFMPDTARWRGLDNPFETSKALFASARWLRELWAQFGNLGLAAAAYNAGPTRVRRWLVGRASLPLETRAYVRAITGEVVEEWRSCARREPAQHGSSGACPDVVSPPAPTPTVPRMTKSTGNEGAWGLQLVGDRSAAGALSSFQSLQARFPGILGNRKPLVVGGRLPGRGQATWYRIRVAEATRERAADLCARLERAGGQCLVQRN